jgi:hypothetical protein
MPRSPPGLPGAAAVPGFALRESLYVAALGAMLLAGALAVGLRDGIRTRCSACSPSSSA